MSAPPGAPLLLGIAVCLLAACSPNETGSMSSSASSTGSGMPQNCAATPPAAATDWCLRIPAGPKGGSPVVAANLAALNAGVRFFGPVVRYADADQALASMLDAPSALSAPDLATYAQQLGGIVCALGANERAFGPAALEPLGDGAVVIIPGYGLLEVLPPGTSTVILDLRGLSDDPNLRSVLDQAVSLALATPVERPKQQVRKHEGMLDEVFSAQNVYTNALVNAAEAPIPANGQADLPIVVLTEAMMPPEAVALAGTLRLANRAWIYGEDLLTEVAEARWVSVTAQQGGAHLSKNLLAPNDDRWPDVIPADLRLTDPLCALKDPTSGVALPTGSPPPLTLGPADRPSLHAVKPFNDKQPTTLTLGSARAAVLGAHSAVRTFFPDFISFPAPGPGLDGWDKALQKPLSDLDAAKPLDRPAVINALWSLGAALNDGHNFVFNYGPSSAVGYFLVMIEDINDAPVVRSSATPGVDPGDTITAIAGVPADAWYKPELARTSAGTPGYRFNLATRRYLVLDGPTEFSLVDTFGQPKKVTVDPASSSAYVAFGVAPSLRKAGWLADLGAPSLYYINLASDVLTDIQAFRAALADAEAAPAKGLVLDMRGYPGINHYEVAARLIPKSFKSPQFIIPTLTGLDQRVLMNDPYSLSPMTGPSFAGPIVLLVGHGTVSAAENFSTMLVDAKRVTVVGRQSAGTNGNITGVELPGAFSFTFTGMEVLHADGSPFLGIGIKPAMDVPLTAADFHNGIDPELVAAISVLPP